MLPSQRALERISRRLGGPRVLALPLLRGLAVLAGLVWVLLAPSEHAGWRPVDGILRLKTTERKGRGAPSIETYEGSVGVLLT